MQAFLYGYYSTKSAGFQCYHYRIMAVMSYLSPALFSFEISLYVMSVFIVLFTKLAINGIF